MLSRLFKWAPPNDGNYFPWEWGHSHAGVFPFPFPFPWLARFLSHSHGIPISSGIPIPMVIHSFACHRVWNTLPASFYLGMIIICFLGVCWRHIYVWLIKQAESIMFSGCSFGRPSLNIYSAWCDITSLSGRIWVKRDTNIDYVSIIVEKKFKITGQWVIA